MQLKQLILVVDRCPEEYLGTKQVELPDSGGSIGRNNGCTLTLVDHNRFISGTHCLISVYGDTYYLSDVSTNGTLINGEKILKNQPVSLHDGDSISLGQYDFSVSFESISTTVDIASDIAPERDSIDPLVSLGKAPTESLQESRGALEDMFLETSQAEDPSLDPVTHLQFSMGDESEHLIADDQEHRASNSVESTAEPSTQQWVDDSLSIDSEFDVPNLIPEDWIGSAGSANHDIDFDAAENSNILAGRSGSVSSDEMPPKDVEYSAKVDSNLKGSATAVNAQNERPHWEEVTRPFTPSQSAHDATEEPQRKDNLDSPALSYTGSASEDARLAFFKGLGIEDPSLFSNKDEFYLQMGTCLRLCIENFQSQLQEVVEAKGEEESELTESDLTTLMLTLNQQSLLSPRDLIEQVIDELEEHKQHHQRATKEALDEHMMQMDPKEFAKEVSSESRFMTKRGLWKDYCRYYNEHASSNSTQSINTLIKNKYQRLVKEAHV
ncbi:type VI secretion system-associated FHA domain protein TagH [Vibrio mexicanus]|uniref:type VI secretion system-associated FHA domain protein TagH n=1 Tax=Vibrio mexicanus TaxID=1004326 RepID=UPI00063BFBF6|nr:type VI secretion system-associated FHA domain protein TagH [Vibrio mexicanus]